MAEFRGMNAPAPSDKTLVTMEHATKLLVLNT
jgi:hypothetical protein